MRQEPGKWKRVREGQTKSREWEGNTTLVNHRTYDSFGDLKSQTNAAVEHLFAYTGRFLDELTGDQNHLHRWYDPDIAQWLSEDPIGFAGGDANLKRYVGNSPANYVDPTGLVPPQLLGSVHPTPSAPLPPPPFPRAPGGAVTSRPIAPVGQAAAAAVIGNLYSGGKADALTNYPHLYPDRGAPVPGGKPIGTIPDGAEKDGITADPGGKLYGPLLPNQFVGPAGTGTCVGVVIHAPGAGTAVFHFDTHDEPIRTLKQWRWPEKSHAVVCGGDSKDPGSRTLYDLVIQALNAAGIRIDGVTPAAEVYGGLGPGGKPTWFLPRKPVLGQP